MKVTCIFCNGYGCCYCDHSGKVQEDDECYQASLLDNDKFEDAQIETCIENSKFKDAGYTHHPFYIRPE